MTTVTEAAKRLIGDEDDTAIREGDLGRMCEEPTLARRFARQLVEAASEIAPGREWSIEDLHDVLMSAVQVVPAGQVRMVEGRHFRKRLREQCAVIERYGESFACVVLTLSAERPNALYTSVLDAVTERLRRTDMVFLYRKRVALILPRMGPDALQPFIERLRALVAVGPGEDALVEIAALAYPNDAIDETQGVLDWAEDQLRDI